LKRKNNKGEEEEKNIYTSSEEWNGKFFLFLLAHSSVGCVSSLSLFPEATQFMDERENFRNWMTFKFSRDEFFTF
jgi:hypothetical protein